MMGKLPTDDHERRAMRLQLIMREYDLTNESAVLVDDLALNAADKAAESLVLVVNSSPNETIRTAVMIHALRMVSASTGQSAELNEVIRAMAVDIGKATGLPLHEVLAQLGAQTESGKGAPASGDTCECPACMIRRSVMGVDPNYDAVKARDGDPGVKLGDLVRGLFGRGKGKPH